MYLATAIDALALGALSALLSSVVAAAADDAETRPGVFRASFLGCFAFLSGVLAAARASC